MDEACAEELLGFWARTGVLTADEGRRRLPEVVCVVRDEAGAIAGACSVYATDVPLIGGRRFWVFRSLLPGAAAACFPALVERTFAVLDAEFEDEAGAPVGLCVLLDETQRRSFPEAVWPRPRLVYAGYTIDGLQVRIGYFEGARVHEGKIHLWDGVGPDGYRAEAFAEQDAITRQDVIDLWLREGGLREAEAQRRIDEVEVVVIGPGDRLAGVCTAYLHHNDQLHMDLWYARVMVAPWCRGIAVSLVLALSIRRHLGARHASGDTRGMGVAFEVENQILNTYYPQALWWPTDYTFVGETAHGVPVRVHFFEGVAAPGPPTQGSE